MTGQSNLNKFNIIYDETYYDVLKYIVIKCHNVNDANDILQETYYEFWKILNSKKIEDINIKSYIKNIANNKIKKHYSLLKKIKTISIFSKVNDDYEIIETLKDSFDIEKLFINENDWNNIWDFLKNKKNQNIPKVFYLYYKCDLKINTIAKELNVSESYIKNIIYRTLKELKENYKKENE